MGLGKRIVDGQNLGSRGLGFRKGVPGREVPLAEAACTEAIGQPGVSQSIGRIFFDGPIKVTDSSFEAIECLLFQ